MSSHQTLEAATQDRKLRLAKLKSLKRKQSDVAGTTLLAPDDDFQRPSVRHKSASSRSPSPDVTATHLSGRNYDSTARGPRLGYETNPSAGQQTLELQATELAAKTKAAAEEEEKADKPLDLFKLQPKKPNWDLKRDLQLRTEVLNVRTDNAIARIVRERVGNAQMEAKERAQLQNRKVGNDATGDGDAIGMEGGTLVEATREMEREQESERDAGAGENLV